MLADDGAGGARAGTLIEFRNLSDRGPARLAGYLARPDTGLSAILGGDAGAFVGDADGEVLRIRRCGD